MWLREQNDSQGDLWGPTKELEFDSRCNKSLGKFQRGARRAMVHLFGRALGLLYGEVVKRQAKERVQVFWNCITMKCKATFSSQVANLNVHFFSNTAH